MLACRSSTAGRERPEPDCRPAPGSGVSHSQGSVVCEARAASSHPVGRIGSARDLLRIHLRSNRNVTSYNENSNGNTVFTIKTIYFIINTGVFVSHPEFCKCLLGFVLKFRGRSYSRLVDFTVRRWAGGHSLVHPFTVSRGDRRFDVNHA